LSRFCVPCLDCLRGIFVEYFFRICCRFMEYYHTACLNEFSNENLFGEDTLGLLAELMCQRFNQEFGRLSHNIFLICTRFRIKQLERIRESPCCAASCVIKPVIVLCTYRYQLVSTGTGVLPSLAKNNLLGDSSLESRDSRLPVVSRVC
jgi:hypothetical protein